ncbi:hypothetical protein LPJ53_000865 [Coemansia erecta]|uniref:ATP11-domain-containing protein n=1 Tax=Coemansia erecta TaxID=147472 RepID=A0A9W7Y6Q0_9FUNG|nr:hypothetical protein LPJ53_000865 [Coemansia erecta]
MSFRLSTALGRSKALLTTGVRTGARGASHVSPLTLSRLTPLGYRSGVKLMSHVPNYDEKYRSKLLEKAKAEGVSSIEELKKKIKHSATSSTANATASDKSLPQTTTASSKKADAAKSRQSNLPPSVKTLDQILRIDLLESKNTQEIGEIWNQYHATKDTISAAIPAATYGDLLAVAKKNPLFVLPLPRESGVEFFFLQFDHHQVHFTSLLEYKQNTVNARPYLTLTHYTDLMDSKDVVLMRGEMDGEQKFIDVQNAQYLALQMQMFYVTGGPEKRGLVEKFNQQPELFDYQELLEQAEKLQ